jgi:hypothetical protein
MKKKLQTIFDRINSADTHELVYHIAKMMALQDKEYQDAVITSQLQDQLAFEMLAFATKTKGQNFEVTCSYAGVTQSSTFRAMELFSIVDGISDKMDVETYMDEVVRPISTELAARVISKVNGPLSETECDISVGLA